MLELINLAIAAVGALATSLSAGADIAPFFQNSKEVNSLKENVETLSKKLCAMMEDYENEVVLTKTKKRSKTYESWIDRVVETTACIKSLIDKSKSREQNKPSEITKELESHNAKLEKLIKEGNGMKNKLLVRAPPETVEKMKAPDFRNSETLQGKLDRILKHLENGHVKGVKVSGTMGVGKTAILKNLNNHEKVANMFDIVIWVKVSTEEDQNNLSIEHLQRSILKRLKLKLKGNMHCHKVARRISTELKGKKYLLLMDDVKGDLDLSHIGIPSIEDGCKIVLATRQRHTHVFHDFIDVIVKVKSLSNDEAWIMFKDVLQCPSLVKDPNIGPVAWEICKQCGGLPLLIEKVASTFKVKVDVCLWQDGLHSLRTWPQKECQGIKEMIDFFKICYNDLNDAQKQCFLYGALYPEDSDIYIKYLLERWRAEDFLVDQNYEEGNEAVSASLILSHLKNVSLLEESKGEKYVSMQKFIRLVAFDILSKDPECLYLVKTDGALKEPMDAKSWCQKRYVSLSNNVHFQKLPDEPDASMLSTLFLQKSSNLEQVPESFFNNMKELRVLDFCESDINFLPKPLPVSLKVLCLSDCMRLKKLPLDHEDQSHLEVLDISRSGIIGIPILLKKMKRLRCLRISLAEYKVENVNTNAFKIISELPELEELVIDMGPCEQSLYKAVILSILTNVVTLKKFTNLEFSIGDHVENIIDVGGMISRVQVPDAKIFQDSTSKSFYERATQSKYIHIFIDCDKKETQGIPDYFKYSMYIKYFNGEGNILRLPNQFEKSDVAFELMAHKNIKELSSFEVANITNKITAFFVGSCEEIEHIIGEVDSKALSNIKHLYLDKLPKLESIWKDPLQQFCLTNLQTLCLSECPKLTKLFPHGTVQHLIHLKTLRIKNCSEIVEIFEESDTTGTPYVLQNLKELIIVDMLKLEFISKDKSVQWTSLEEFKVSNCPCLQDF